MKTFFKIVIGLAIIGVIAAVAIYVFVYNKPHPDYEKMTPVFTLTAADLYKEFKADAPGANKKYTGQLIELSGVQGKTEVSDSLIVVVFVFNQGAFGDEGIRCSVLPDQKDVARKLKTGDPIRIKGYCTGFNDTDVILEQCTIL
jgi:hypothetical protein